ncbi:MAG: sigma 54-interacting transcriptional regulator [Thermodesulfobacteriota bacterium]
MPTILFSQNGPPDKAILAAAAVRSLGKGKIQAAVAADQLTPKNPLILEMLREVDCPLPDVLSIDSFSPFEFDLIVCFCEKTEPIYPALPGNPALVRWYLADPMTESHPEKSSSGWRMIYRRIDQLVRDLLEQGYLDALVQARNNSELLLDNLSEGIVAHGLNRRFFFFNRAAEEITGVSRENVLGRDCHDVFPEKFCTNHCTFCEENLSIPMFPTKPYPITVRRPDGENRQVEMHVVPLRDNLNTPIGVVASMKDVTREQELVRRLGETKQFAGIIGRDASMLDIFQTISELAESSVPVLVLGESGTGKEMVAAAIHNEGDRVDKRFVTVNCGALPDTLLESELFGHVRGAFTGAVRNKKGRFELAHGGTIFLDEIGDISSAMQVKLLRVLQDGIIQRLGSEGSTQVDVRVIAATHKDLNAEIEAGRFREDLYYRLCVVPVQLPPLRKRIGDLPLLTSHFIGQAAAEEGREEPTLSQETLNLLMEYNWPGNVRELQNIIRYLMVKCPESKIDPQHLPPDFRRQQSTLTPTGGRRRSKLDAARVQQAIGACNGNKAKAARHLGVGRATLYRFLDHHPSLK